MLEDTYTCIVLKIMLENTCYAKKYARKYLLR